MLKEIPLSHLVVGMYVDHYGDGTLQNPLHHMRDYVHAQADIEALGAQGVTCVVVDTDKGVGMAGPAPRLDDMAESRRIYTRCLDHVTGLLETVRQGAAIEPSQGFEAVDALLRDVERNPANLALLGKLQRYDDYTLRHSLNVSLFSLIFGRHLGMEPGALRRLGLAGLFHDLGKFRIPLQILNKPARLSEREFAVMQLHSQVGYELLKAWSDLPEDILLGVLHHHERFDGKGYPKQLLADEKDPFSRVLTIVDIYDALTSTRPYKKAMPPHVALKAMFAWRNESFHPGLLERFVECFGVYPPGSLVRLTDQTHALVLAAREHRPDRPLVKVAFTKRLTPQLPQIVDLADSPTAKDGGLDIEACVDPLEHKLDLEKFAV